MEELKAMFRVCYHIKKDGVRCNSPAMKGMNFCYQHIGGNIRELTRARSTYVGPKLDFVYPGDRQSIQHNFFVISQAMNDGKLDLQTYCAYSRTFSACERNLRRWETLYQKDSPDKELAPLPNETPADENLGAPHLEEMWGKTPEHNNDAGAPHLEETWEKTPEQHESLSGEQTQPDENLGAPHLEEMWEKTPEQPETEGAPFKPGVGLSGEQTDSPNVTPTEAAPNTFDTQTIDFKKYDSRFKELERLYSDCPDYGDRVRAAIRQIHHEEEQAWLAAGCP